jgi:Cft2 family RNA processing exonuclease
MSLLVFVMEVELIPVSNDTERFYCSILRINNVRILLDCGWDERMNIEDYEHMLSPSQFSEIDMVLLSHYSLAHVGALPYMLFRDKSLMKKTRLLADYSGPRIVATEAVRRLGELALSSLHEDIDKVKNPSVSDDSYSLSIEDIVSGFALVQPVQLNETVQVAPNISVTFQPAGRLMGGAYCVITVGSQRIVYATDYSLVAKNSLPGLVIGPACKPGLLITDACPTPTVATNTVNLNEFEAVVRQTLRGGGTVLVPVDPTTDVLELLVQAERMWAQDAGLEVYPAVFVSALGDVVLDQVKTRMEWLNEHVVREFEESVNFAAHPFMFSHVQLCAGLGDFFEKFPRTATPKLIFASGSHLDFGDSRELLCRIAPNSNNLVMLTSKPLPGSLAEKIVKHAPGADDEISFLQYVKTPFSDEQLRQIYRECLEKEAQDDELRRRRMRERMPQQTSAAAPSSAAAVPVDLIRGTGTYEGDSAGGNFFRPQLFASQTVASGAILGSQRQVSDYGEQLNTIEVDTWRAHAEMSDLGAAREAQAEMAAAAQHVKAERGIKGEIRIKGDIDASGGLVKGELGVATDTASSSFDWRRDLQVRFGEPQKVEQRERSVKVACKVKILSPPSQGQQRREFLSSVRAENVVVLPTRNLHDLQLVSLMVRSEGKNFFATQEDIVPSLNDDGLNEAPPLPLPVSLSLPGEKKWIHIDPQLQGDLPFKGLNGSDVRLARLEQTIIVPASVTQTEDLIQVPSGELIDAVIAKSNLNSKRKRDQSSSSLLVSAKPFRLCDFAQTLKTHLPQGSGIEFVSNENTGRVLSVNALGGQVVVIPARNGVLEILGTPSPCFYKVRELLYSSTVAI